MNALAAVALALLAAAQDPRAFRMPKKATPPKAEQPKPEQPAPVAKPIMFELPKPTPPPPPPAEPARPTPPPTANRQPPTKVEPPPSFTLPGQPPKRKKAPTPRTFRLPDKNDVSN